MTSEAEYLFSPAEWAAIHVHKYYLSKRKEHEVPLREVIRDWLKNYAEKWRETQKQIRKNCESDTLAERCYSPAEWKAINVHRYFLSRRHSRWVSNEEAIDDWEENYARTWREKRLKLSSRNQMEQILKHKWLESEKVGHDMGTEAVTDWIEKYAGIWRQWWESEEE